MRRTLRFVAAPGERGSVLVRQPSGALAGVTAQCRTTRQLAVQDIGQQKRPILGEDVEEKIPLFTTL